MIDKKYIKSAVRIRKDYLNLMNGLNNYQSQAQTLASDLQNIVTQFTKIQEDIDNKKITKAEDAESKIMKVISELETKMGKITSKITSLDSDVEKLKKEELELYHQIKRKYPQLQDSEIVAEISTHLVE